MSDEATKPGVLLPSLRIENFRCFKDLTIPKLARVNLIVGKNGVGKTTLLEALRIYFSKSRAGAILSILSDREDFVFYGDQPLDVVALAKKLQSLFYGPPPFRQIWPKILIGENGADAGIHIELWALPPSQAEIEDVSRKPDWSRMYLNIQDKFENREQIPFSKAIQSIIDFDGFVEMSEGDEAIRCAYVPSSNLGPARAVGLWDKVNLTDLEPEIVRAGQLIDPRIQRISVTGLGSGHGKVGFIVRLADQADPVPLHSLGEGVGRIIGLALALATHRNGAVLIDEAENGIHWSVQPKLWEVIFTLAERLNVQVFATTHSNDCVGGFAHAARAHGDNGLLIRLEEWNGELRARSIDVETAEIAAEGGMELR